MAVFTLKRLRTDNNCPPAKLWASVDPIGAEDAEVFWKATSLHPMLEG